MKSVYVIQPYKVGSKHSESLALIIPAEVRRHANINTSTVFMLKIDEKIRKITLENIDKIIEKCENTMIPAEKSFLGSNQQASPENQ